MALAKQFNGGSGDSVSFSFDFKDSLEKESDATEKLISEFEKGMTGKGKGKKKLKKKKKIGSSLKVEKESNEKIATDSPIISCG
jgi:hypothetical protein